MIYNFFPSPVLIKQLDESLIDKVLTAATPHLKELERSCEEPHFNNYDVINSSLDMKQDFDFLYREICDAKQEFLEKTGIDADETSIKSWIQQYKTEHDYHQEHHHGVYGISGVFYMQANEQAGRLVFTNPNPLCKYQQRQFETEFTADFVYVKPVPGTLVMFPSWLMHEAEKGDPGVVKSIIAFNLGSKATNKITENS
jgi:uncharacterized protein (TIGR02466 family)